MSFNGKNDFENDMHGVGNVNWVNYDLEAGAHDVGKRACKWLIKLFMFWAGRSTT